MQHEPIEMSAPGLDADDIVEIEASELELREDLTSVGGLLSCCSWFKTPV